MSTTEQQFLDTYFGGRADLFKTISSIALKWQTIHINRRTFRDLVVNECLKYLDGVFEKTKQFPTLIERYWWSVVFETAGLNFTDIVINSYIQYLVENHWQRFKEDFTKMKNEGAVPSNIKTAEEYLSLRFAPPKVRLYTNDPVYQALGVRTEKELDALSNSEYYFLLAKMVTDGTFIRLHNATYHDYQRDYEWQGASDKVSLFSEYIGLEPGAEDRIEYLNDSDRLSQFFDLAGIDRDTLTDGESNRVLDMLGALDTGYDFASKKGVSMQAYYGDRADSEKTQRQRLFKKIREASDKAK